MNLGAILRKVVPVALLMMLATATPALAQETIHDSGPLETQAASCSYDLIGPTVDNDGTFDYISYGIQGSCGEPISYVIDVDLAERVFDSYITTDSTQGSGVSANPSVFGVTDSCTSATPTTYQVYATAPSGDGFNVAVIGPDVTLPCAI